MGLWISLLSPSFVMSKTRPGVCVFGGSFDPPHLGHIEVAEKMASSTDCEHLYIVAKNGFLAEKPNRTNWHYRMEMLKAVFKEHKNISVPNVDIYATIESIRKSGKLVVGITGSDRALNPTHEYEKMQVDRWVVCTRIADEAKPEVLNMTKFLGKPVLVRSFKEHGNSSTAVRKHIRKNLPIEGAALHPRVISFIKQHNLYGFKGKKL